MRAPSSRRLLGMMLEVRLLDEQIGQLNQEMANLLRLDIGTRSSNGGSTPGLGVDSAQQIIAEVGATAPFLRRSTSRGLVPVPVGSAGVNYSHRSPKGNRNMRRILNQAANAAVKAKGTIFEIVYRRMVLRLGHRQTIGNWLRIGGVLIWKLLHRGSLRKNRGPGHQTIQQRRTAKDDPATPSRLSS